MEQNRIMKRLVKKADLSELDKKCCEQINAASKELAEAKQQLDEAFKNEDGIGINNYLNVKTILDETGEGKEYFLGQYAIDSDIGPGNEYAYTYFENLLEAANNFQDKVENLFSTLKKVSNEFNSATNNRFK